MDGSERSGEDQEFHPDADARGRLTNENSLPITISRHSGNQKVVNGCYLASAGRWEWHDMKCPYVSVCNRWPPWSCSREHSEGRPSAVFLIDIPRRSKIDKARLRPRAHSQKWRRGTNEIVCTHLRGSIGGHWATGVCPTAETRSTNHAPGTNGGAGGRIGKERGGPRIPPRPRRPQQADEREFPSHHGFNIPRQREGGD